VQGPISKGPVPSDSVGTPEGQEVMNSAEESKDGGDTTGSVTPRPPTAASNITLRQHHIVRKSSFTEGLEPEEEIPPVPPLPSGLQHHTSILSRSPSPPPLAGNAPKTLQSSPSSQKSSVHKLHQHKPSKAGSARSVSVRESLRRSISTRDGTSQFGNGSGIDAQVHSGWNVMELLETIDMDGPGAPPGSTAKGLGNGLKPPY